MIAQVRQALADALANPDLQVSPYALSQPVPPGIQILPPAIVYDYSMGMHEWTFTVQGFVSFNTDRGAQMLLDQLIEPGGSRSVKVLLEADKTLGGLVQTLHVPESSKPIMADPTGGSPMLLVEWPVVIVASENGG